MATLYSCRLVNLNEFSRFFEKIYFLHFLQYSLNFVIFLQVINTHLTVIKNLSDIYSSVDEIADEGEKRYDVVINGHVEQPSGTGVDREMRELQESIRLMSDSSHQPLRIFTVNNSIEK